MKKVWYLLDVGNERITGLIDGHGVGFGSNIDSGKGYGVGEGVGSGFKSGSGLGHGYFKRYDDNFEEWVEKEELK